VHGVPEALPHRRSSNRTIPLGNRTHILAGGVAKGALVGLGYVLNWREDCEGEGHKEERGAAV
jgi:hypothetical protein